MSRRAYAAAAALLAFTLTVSLAGCGDDDEPEPAPEPSASTPTSPSPTGSPTSPSSPTSGATGLPAGGSADDPAIVEPTTTLLDWQPVKGPVRDTVTRSGDWTLTVTRNGAGYSLNGPTTSSGSASNNTRISDALIDGAWAVVVAQDKAEEHPARATVTDLETGDSFKIDGRSDVPTTNGGTWALGEGRILHATIGPGRAYCLASVDLETRRSTLGWCAPKRHGFNNAHITPAGDSILTFDSSHPSCRTLVSVNGKQTEPLPGVPDCKGWDGLLAEDGAVWSTIPKETAIEDATFFARVGDGYFDLGPGIAGSLVWCGDASYFVRDPQTKGGPATLMRWSARDGLSVAYESAGGQAFLSEPRCGGDQITITALTSKGDEQVTADL
jgi:hypothetical protein